jgi:hypothetical protein
MESEVIVAVLGLVGTLSGSFLGAIATSRLTQYRLQKLEEKVSLHNNIVERTYILEGKITECIHDITDLKAYHRP